VPPSFGSAEPPRGSGQTRPSEGVAAAGFSAPEPPAAIAQPAFLPPQLIFQPPEVVTPPAGGGQAAGTDRPGSAARRSDPARSESDTGTGTGTDDAAEPAAADGDESAAGTAGEDGSRRRRRRGGRGRSKGRADDNDDDDAGQDADDGSDKGTRAASGRAAAADDTGAEAADDDDTDDDDAESGDGPARRRRRRRRRGGTQDGDQPAPDDPPDTVVHVRQPRPAPAARAKVKDEVQGLKGSTRLEAKKQRRREGRDSGRRRPPIISESEFLARREAVDRAMVVRQRGDRTQIGVLEDGILVEHYVDKTSHQSFVGNVYLGKVQNVLPSMEAAFVDIGKGRNAVLYAGEVNFDASGLEGQTRRIESALKSGQSVLVQVTKDPIGHKGARLTSQVSLPGRYLVYVPGASMTGISRKLPDTERTRLKQILKKVMPEGAGVIVRTAAEGATEEELSQDVARLSAQWENIERKSKSASPPELLYSEPDLTIRVVRDIFNEDFTSLVVDGDDGWDMVDEYVRYVAPHLIDRLSRWQGEQDVFASHRIDEQLAKALDRKVYLPSGGSLVIDRTEAMSVIDVNTGKFTGQGGNLEETVTRNNLEAAEEIVRQLRLRDIGGIIVIDFIDMVLESNRDLVLRRLLECLARDRTKHQVAEVTSLGLVQMTRKRVGSGLLEAFSVTCECCNGRGVHVSLEPTELAPAGQRRRNGDDKGHRNGDDKSHRNGDDKGHRNSDEQGRPDGEAVASTGTAGEDKPSGSSRRRRRKPAALIADNGAPSPDADAPPSAEASAEAAPGQASNGDRHISGVAEHGDAAGLSAG
jgi:ribonuclease E